MKDLNISSHSASLKHSVKHVKLLNLNNLSSKVKGGILILTEESLVGMQNSGCSRLLKVPSFLLCNQSKYVSHVNLTVNLCNQAVALVTVLAVDKYLCA